MNTDARRAKRPRGRGWRWLLVLAVLVATVMLVKAIAVDVFLVVEQSMWPGFHGDEDRILVQRLARNPRRWQIWLYEGDDDVDRPFVKRVVALQGEFIDMRMGDLYVGPSPDRMERLVRPPAIVDALLVPLFPTPAGEGGVGRFNVRAGSLKGDGDALSLSGNVVAHLKSGLAATVRENIYDDHLGNEGDYREGEHVVTDVRVDLRIDGIEGDGQLQVWHDLRGRGERRALCVGRGEISVRVGDFERGRVKRLPWDEKFPIALRMETIDGRFRVVRLNDTMQPERVLADERRDTSVYHGYSRVRIVLDGGEARLSSLRVARDVHWAWPVRRTNPGAYYVDGGCFFLGDNAPVSDDSRKSGPVANRRLVGRAWRIVWPTDRTRVLP